MRVVVTGGAGFIGSHVCEALLARDWTVTALDNFDDFYDPVIKRRNLDACIGHDKFKLVEGDIRNEDQVDRVLADAEVVVHLAARAGVRPSIERPLLYEDVNVRGTAVLLEGARRHAVKKFVFGSSSSVYGNNEKIPFAECDRVDHPISPYAATKKAGELLCHAYCHLFGLNVTCLRFFTVYGPRQRPDLAIRKFCRLIDKGEAIPVYGPGDTQRDYTYISDIVAGVLAALESCDGYHLYNLGESEPIRLSELIERIEKALGKKAKIDRLAEQPGDVRVTYADVSLARKELGYEPSVSIDEGLARFVEWLRKG